MLVQTSVNKCFKQSKWKCLLFVNKVALLGDSSSLLVAVIRVSQTSVENPAYPVLVSFSECLLYREQNQHLHLPVRASKTSQGGRALNFDASRRDLCNVRDFYRSATGVASGGAWSFWPSVHLARSGQQTG